MPSPIGHLVFAFSIANLRKKSDIPILWFIILISISALAADFDFLPGIFIDDPNKFHHGPAHSVTAGFIYTCCIKLLFPKLSRSVILTIFLVYQFHLLADLLAYDPGEPFGIKLLWPFMSDYFISPYTIFTNFDHGSTDSNITNFIHGIFSFHNLWAISIELIILLPLFFFSIFARKKDLYKHKKN